MQILKEEMRQRILEVSGEMFLAQGYDAATMRGIAREVPVSASNLYKYYRDKSDIFNALVRDFHNGFLSASEMFLAEDNDGNYTPDNLLSVAGRLAGALHRHRLPFLLLMENPRQLPLGQFGRILVERLTTHLIGGTRPDTVFDNALIGIIARQIWDGITGIVKSGGSEHDMRQRFISYLKYHFRGLSLFHDTE